MKTRNTVAVILLLSVITIHAPAEPLCAGFTYQAALAENGNPARGSYDLQFTLFDASSGGARAAGPTTNSAVAVSNGLFTVTLDFDKDVFVGNARWLEIGVRTNGSASEFTTLAPRQALTPTPYALFAPNAGTAASVPAASIVGTIADGQLSTNVARLDGNQTFTGTVQLPNPANAIAGTAVLWPAGCQSNNPALISTNGGFLVVGRPGAPAPDWEPQRISIGTNMGVGGWFPNGYPGPESSLPAGGVGSWIHIGGLGHGNFYDDHKYTHGGIWFSGAETNWASRTRRLVHAQVWFWPGHRLLIDAVGSGKGIDIIGDWDAVTQLGYSGGNDEFKLQYSCFTGPALDGTGNVGGSHVLSFFGTRSASPSARPGFQGWALSTNTSRGQIRVYATAPYTGRGEQAYGYTDGTPTNGVYAGAMGSLTPGDVGWDLRGRVVKQRLAVTVSAASYTLDAGAAYCFDLALMTNVAFATSNWFVGPTNIEEKLLILRAGPAERTNTFPAWRWANDAGSATPPTILAARTVQIVTLRCVGLGDSNIIAHALTAPDGP